ncbi:MAG: phenylalanyl-tRNA synthetase beta chain, partial [Patescibacteria group bacterium]|nr:phenylalanyl-tRNA synthetase beta chain [Patescibacteria group bacterium]
RGIIGEFTTNVYKNFKLPEASAGFELDLGFISENFNLDPNYKPLSKFPSISQDITIDDPLKTLFRDLEVNITAKLNKATEASGVLYTLKPVSIFRKSDSTTKSTTFNIEFHHPERTLTTTEVNKLVQKLK